MGKTIRDILDEFRANSADETEKGRKFEHLMKAFLKRDLQYSRLYDEVWLWSEYPNRGKRPDTGIDLVARERATGNLVAVQCKFYSPDTVIDKPAVDSFLATSSKDEFGARLFITTTDQWGRNAKDALIGQNPPVSILSVADLDQSSIDWSTFSIENLGKLKTVQIKKPRPHQIEAIDACLEGLRENDRGRLIMACGTGKTFTSLRFTEQFLPNGGMVLFLVPSISLLSQAVKEWSINAEADLTAFAVCSDSSAGKRKNDEDMPVSDLAFPATTDATAFLEKFNASKFPAKGLRVVFSTYQSIGVVADAQSRGLGEFDLIICDEAHRTTGVTLEGEESSFFVKVHDNNFLKGEKRLYMTATPKVFTDAIAQKAEEAGAVLSDMGDENVFGPELHRLGFGEAVERDILSDYKVLVLAVDEQYVAEKYQKELASEDNQLNLEDTAKIVGCWNGLSKRSLNPEDFKTDPEPMRRAVAFARSIAESKVVATMFQQIVDKEMSRESGVFNLKCEVQHVDGTFSSFDRNEKLDWLKKEPPPSTARILSNARCLTEGVDVPALDAIMFLKPRDSQIDVVQAVGRVMRKLEGKKYGYVILPIAVPAGVDPEVALSDNKKYKVVWQVLQALRSHDERFDAMVNRIDLTGKSPQLEIIGVGGESPEESVSWGETELQFPNFDSWRDAILAKIVEKVGERRYWEKWAGDVAEIASRYTLRIQTLLQTGDEKVTLEFDKFLKGVRSNLNPSVTAEEAIEMLSQHMITQPVFDALFEGYEFSKLNPVSQVMQVMVETLESYNLDRERASLEAFYESVRLRASGISSASAKQKIVKELYETFFKVAFPKMAQRLGIVYTPIEVVDFMLHATEELLKSKFNKKFSDKNVHVLDPFTGTGTFIVRLLQLGLLDGVNSLYKFRTELHANEIVLLAYYVAAINIEEAFNSISGNYEPFGGIVLTDTFQMTEEDDELDIGGVFRANNERVAKQNSLPVQVIIGNPPYSVGQSNQNDNNKNLTYKFLDRRVEETYAAESVAGNRRGLYDSYVKAFRWATDRLDKSRGLVAFVSNGSWLDTRSADGMRKTLAKEYSEIWVYNLKGNIRKFNKAEGGNVFGSGSMTPITITFLLKDGSNQSPATIHYAEIPDGLSTQQKLEEISRLNNLAALDWVQIEPNNSGDWLNLRTEKFSSFMPIGSKAKGSTTQAMFDSYFTGVVTSRDAWSYNFSKLELEKNMRRMVDTYTQHVDRYSGGPVDDFIDTDGTKISWSRALKNSLSQRKKAEYDNEHIRLASYRPFQKNWLYTDRIFVEAPSLAMQFFPKGKRNLVIVVPAPSDRHNPGVYITDDLPDFHLEGVGVQCFPLYSFSSEEDGVFADLSSSPYAISDEACAEFSKYYGFDIDGEALFYYTFGILSAPEYQETFRSDLKKQLPHIPKAKDFRSFEKAGRKLAELTLGYESLDEYPLQVEAKSGFDYSVEKMVLTRGPGASSLTYNSKIQLHGIPESAFEYKVFGRAPIEWVVSRYQRKVDKGSGLVSDPNLWCQERGEPDYIKKLVAKSITLSIEAAEVIHGLPKLEVEQ